MRRQHVFLDFGRLQGDAARLGMGEVSLWLQTRLEELLAVHGVVLGPGSPSVELRILEYSLQQLLLEVCSAAMGDVAARWISSPFRHEDLHQFDDVIGADGQHSNVRHWLMARVPKVKLYQRVISTDFAYNCHLEWQEGEKFHSLKRHKYEKWRPALLFHQLRRREMPEYINISRSDCEAVQRCFRRLCRSGSKPYTDPFPSVSNFLDYFRDDPQVQHSICSALQSSCPSLDLSQPALLAPVEQTLHRSPYLVSHRAASTSDRNQADLPFLWLVGDAAVSLPVSKGCNLVYHIASAGKLAATLIGNSDPQMYEDFVLESWHAEVWKPGRGSVAALPGLAKSVGRFVS